MHRNHPLDFPCSTSRSVAHCSQKHRPDRSRMSTPMLLALKNVLKNIPMSTLPIENWRTTARTDIFLHWLQLNNQSTIKTSVLSHLGTSYLVAMSPTPPSSYSHDIYSITIIMKLIVSHTFDSAWCSPKPGPFPPYPVLRASSRVKAWGVLVSTTASSLPDTPEPYSLHILHTLLNSRH